MAACYAKGNNKNNQGWNMATSETPATEKTLRDVATSSKYKELIAKRSRFGWTLTVIMLAAYYGYVSLIAFDKAFLAQPIGSGRMSLGIPVGFGLIVFAILLTGVYVIRANREFDRLTEEIQAEWGQ
jgi:uncharacterized membrane protein (DUF485 family)